MKTRWKVTTYYRSNAGSIDVTYDLSELYDPHDIDERRPHWDTIERIKTLKVDQVDGDGLTIEEASKVTLANRQINVNLDAETPK